MKPSARIQTAIDLLTGIAASPIPMDNTIRDFMAGRRYIGSKDRSAIVERVYRIQRRRARLGWHLEQAGAEDTPRARVLADLMLHEETDLRALDEIFNAEKHAPSALSADEKALEARLKGKSADDPAMPEPVRAECPEWAEDKLRALYGADFARQLAAMEGPAPLDLRVNTLKGTVEETQALLAAQGVETDRTPWSPWGLRARSKAFMSEAEAFRSGMVEIQDEGSQLISLLTGAAPGARVLDYCAGGGGKTLGIAAMMEGKGNIVACDLDARRLEKGRQRYRKAGAHNVELRPLSDEQHRKWLRRQKATMDVVLVDAPCSSSGTWRRNPDLRWRWYGPTLEEIKAMQADILERVADKVKPGGRLVYATCSLFAEENEDQVEKFLAAHGDYAVLPLTEAWPEGAGKRPCDGPFLRLTPADHNTDGFFAAVLKRSA